ncbi:MAG: glycosyltransferase family 2 protein [Deltaproteobacteria bacterium]|nr:glycosyltransferase family 2 protein [Deltaproteobacteria bacterium]
MKDENIHSTPDLSLVVPCYNEEESIESTATRLVRVFDRAKVDLELILVDNGSIDSTPNIIKSLMARGLPVSEAHVPVNIGYGNGILKGLETARGRFVGFTCADEQVSAEDTLRVYKKAEANPFPVLAKVRRRFRKDGPRRKVISITYNIAANILFPGLGSIDINGNPKIFPGRLLGLLNLKSRDWFLDAEIVLKWRSMGLRIVEFDVQAKSRRAGKSKVGPATCLEFSINMLRYRLKRFN